VSRVSLLSSDWPTRRNLSCLCFSLPQHDVAVLDGSPFSSSLLFCVFVCLCPLFLIGWSFLIMPKGTKCPCAWPPCFPHPPPDLTLSNPGHTFFYSLPPAAKAKARTMYLYENQKAEPRCDVSRSLFLISRPDPYHIQICPHT
jgi:hypothetical protein